MAAERWVLPVPGGPMSSRGAFVEPAVAAAEGHHVRLGEGRHDGEVEAVDGVLLNSAAELRRGGRWKRRRARSAISCSVKAVSRRAAGQPSRSACAVNWGHRALMVGRRSSLSHQVERRSIDGGWQYSCCASPWSGELGGVVKQIVVVGWRPPGDTSSCTAAIADQGAKCASRGSSSGNVPVASSSASRAASAAKRSSDRGPEYQQPDHAPAGCALIEGIEQRVEGDGGRRFAREQLNRGRRGAAGPSACGAGHG